MVLGTAGEKNKPSPHHSLKMSSAAARVHGKHILQPLGLGMRLGCTTGK